MQMFIYKRIRLITVCHHTFSVVIVCICEDTDDERYTTNQQQQQKKWVECYKWIICIILKNFYIQQKLHMKQI